MKLMFLDKTIFENLFIGGAILKMYSGEQPVKIKGCSSIQFLLREFCQEYKNVLLRFLGLESSIF